MEDRSNEILAVAIFFITLSWIFVLLRIYVKVFMLKNFGLDDWLMVLTIVSFTAYITCQLGGVAHGSGKHYEDITKENRVKALRFWYFCELFYISTTTILKFALIVFILRITVDRIQIWVLRLFMIGNGVFGTIYFFIIMFQCNPISAWWEISPGRIPQCINMDIILISTYIASGLTAVLDWTIGIIPFFIVKDLNMPRNRKLMVAGILAFAAIGSAATIIRLPYLHQFGEVRDFLWGTTDMAIWSTVEPGVGITAGCAVTLRPLLRLCLQKLGIRSTEFSDHPGSQQLPRSHGYSRNPGVTNESSKQQSQSRKPDDPYTLRSLAFYDDTERIVTITGGKNDDDRASSLENVKTTTVFQTYDKPSSPNPSPSPRAWEGV